MVDTLARLEAAFLELVKKVDALSESVDELKKSSDLTGKKITALESDFSGTSEKIINAADSAARGAGDASNALKIISARMETVPSKTSFDDFLRDVDVLMEANKNALRTQVQSVGTAIDSVSKKILAMPTSDDLNELDKSIGALPTKQELTASVQKLKEFPSREEWKDILKTLEESGKPVEKLLKEVDALQEKVSALPTAAQVGKLNDTVSSASDEFAEAAGGLKSEMKALRSDLSEALAENTKEFAAAAKELRTGLTEVVAENTREFASAAAGLRAQSKAVDARLAGLPDKGDFAAYEKKLDSLRSFIDVTSMRQRLETGLSAVREDTRATRNAMADFAKMMKAFSSTQSVALEFDKALYDTVVALGKTLIEQKAGMDSLSKKIAAARAKE
ncbi:MAG: hypothetical protein NTY90_04750 [Candidatus Micrarchaeota archaeon]|nr:hypothetical protein [Candidatus Micrarchaeota archaeon]